MKGNGYFYFTILFASLLLSAAEAVSQTLFYKGDNVPDATVSMADSGIVLTVGSATFFLSPVPVFPLQSFNYATYGVSACISMDMQSMSVLLSGGTSYAYRLDKISQPVPDSYYVPYGGYVPDYDYYDREYDDYADREYYRAEIRELEYKIRDARRSLRRYERMNRKDPSATGMMLIIEQRRLIRTYEDRLLWLQRQLY